jgi:hypothetical protein
MRPAHGEIAQRAKAAPRAAAELDARIARLANASEAAILMRRRMSLQVAVERAEAKRREHEIARPTVSDGAQIQSVLPKAAEY